MAVREVDLESRYGKAASDLELRALQHIMLLKFEKDPSMRHMIELKAIFRRHEKMYFIFPWADGGDLFDFWQLHPAQPASLIEGIITQLLGLAEALASFHKEGFHHGNLKPQKILVFRNEGQHDTWKIAGLSLANGHFHSSLGQDSTAFRIFTPLYAAPEIHGNLGSPQSRPQLCDIWSMGCIILELIMWLLYDIEGVDMLTRPLRNEYKGQSAFWSERKAKKGQRGQKMVHKHVQEHMEKIMGAPVESQAIKDLLRVVRDKLLVVRLPSDSTGDSISGFRADAETLLDDLRVIRKRGAENPEYWYKSGLLFRKKRFHLPPASPWL